MSDPTKPPSDTSVRAAVERLSLSHERYANGFQGYYFDPADIDTLLSYVRAVRDPRLTDAQAAALHIAWLRCKEEGLPDVVEILEGTFDTAFPELGE